jgi:hypothetical protein
MVLVASPGKRTNQLLEWILSNFSRAVHFKPLIGVGSQHWYENPEGLLAESSTWLALLSIARLERQVTGVIGSVEHHTSVAAVSLFSWGEFDRGIGAGVRLMVGLTLGVGWLVSESGKQGRRVTREGAGVVVWWPNMVVVGSSNGAEGIQHLIENSL